IPWGDSPFLRSIAGLLFVAAVLVLVVVAALLFISGAWYRPLAYGAPAAALFALGGVLLADGEHHVGNLAKSIIEIRFPYWPWLVLMLLAPPLVVAFGYRRLSKDEYRPWIVMGVRLLGVCLLILALSEMSFDRTSRDMTVLFVLDRSQSIPEDTEVDPVKGEVDRRTQRVIKFLNDGVQKRGPAHKRDRAGLIVFGRRPRLDLPPSDA